MTTNNYDRADITQMARVTQAIGPGKVQEQTFEEQRFEALAALGITPADA